MKGNLKSIFVEKAKMFFNKHNFLKRMVKKIIQIRSLVLLEEVI